MKNSKVSYKINDRDHTFCDFIGNKFKYGRNEVLSTNKTDITYNQSWYEDGFVEKKFFSSEEFEELKQGLTNCIANIIAQETAIKPNHDFKLEDYHKIITTDEEHFKIVAKTRDLFEGDFDFPVFKYISRFEELLNLQLSNVFKKLNQEIHVIIRINRPFSNDFNPPHKDMYEGYDALDFIPKFLNIWIPIAGVTQNNSLPMVKGSHLINENKILRTFKGGVINGNKYRVRMIKSWEDRNSLIRSKVKDKEALIFSSHIIHGLAINLEKDITRVALEYRLFER